MGDHPIRERRARRAFLSRLTFAAAAGGLLPQAVSAETQTNNFRPATHAEDGWLDNLPGRHRLVIDAVSPAGVDDTLLYAYNFLTANKTGYGVDATDLAIVIVLRHHATAFGYNDAMWTKHGTALSRILAFTDADTHAAPTKNVHNASGLTLDSLAARGVRFAVCAVATRALAVGIAGSPVRAQPIFEELSSNLIGASTLVPAGIVTISRAQERGYTFAYAG
jgi:intracellular sulfur oxidation DsrE/DsrF family protein